MELIAKSGWSYSSLSAYEMCPKKYYHERIAKDVERIAGKQADDGVDIHKSFEQFFLEKKPLPLALSAHTPVVEKIASKLNGALYMAECRYAVKRDLSYCEFDSEDYFARGIADLAITKGEVGAVFDWKSGRPHDNFDQLQLMAIMVMAVNPKVNRVNTAYYWLRDKRLSPRTFTRDTMLNDWNAFVARADRMKADSTFRPHPNFLCKNWCPVKECRYNG